MHGLISLKLHKTVAPQDLKRRQSLQREEIMGDTGFIQNINIAGKMIDHNPQIVSLSTSGTVSSQQTAGKTVWLTADCDCFVLQGGESDTCSTSGTTCGVPLWAKRVYETIIRSDKQHFYAITAAGTGNLYITEVGD
jgi:hypothetical protein